jgi:hypothetical protein
MSLFAYNVRSMSDEDLVTYLHSMRSQAKLEGKSEVKKEMRDVLENLAKRCDASDNGRVAVICWDNEPSNYWGDKGGIDTSVNYITLDARTVRAFKNYICGGE